MQSSTPTLGSIKRKNAEPEVILDKKQKLEKGLKVDSLDPLIERYNEKLPRTSYVCEKCKQVNNGKFYCLDCLIPMNGLKLPKVDLPLLVDVIHHPGEARTKSTALHLQVICGDEKVRTIESTECPDDYDPETTILLFPDGTPNCKAVKDVEDLEKYKKVVIIDGTWNQAKKVRKLPQLSKLRSVQLFGEHRTAFWRPQSKQNDFFLATIEAAYYFIREYAQTVFKQDSEVYDGKYDNILYLFLGQMEVIARARASKQDEEVEEEGEEKKKNKKTREESSSLE